MDVFSESLGMHFTIINIYGPCTDRQQFWDSLVNASIVRSDNIILAGDLNFSLGIFESWGHNAHADTLFNYFRHLLSIHQLVDPLITSHSPTWCNRRTRDDWVDRRLDRFLIKEGLLQNFGYYRQWIGSGGISDHSPTYLEITGEFKKSASPYKFCSVWLQDPDYLNMVNTH